MRWKLLIRLLFLASPLLLAAPAFAQSNVPSLPAGTTLTGTVIYGAEGGTLNRKYGLDTTFFGISAGNITLNAGSLTNSLLAAGSFTNITGVGTLSSLTMGGTLALGTNSLTGNFTATGVPIMSGLSVGTQVSCLGLDVTNHVVLNAAACGTGGGGSQAFSAITSATNNQATMTVGAGAALTFTSTGTVNANQLGGVALLAGTLTNTNFCSYASSGTLLNCNTASTGSGNVVRDTNAVLTTPNLGTPGALVATNATGTAAGLTAGTATVANGLKSATTTVSVSSATAPTAGQILTATSATAADWETVSGTGTVTSVAAGCGTSTGGSPITTTGTVLAALINRSNTAATDTLVAGDCGNFVQENRSSAVAVSIAQAGTTGFATGYYTTVCNINSGVATITPTTSTIGGASSYALAAGSAFAPRCVALQSDGSNYNIVDTSGTTQTMSIGWIAGVNPNNTLIGVLPAAATIVSIVGNVEVATGSAATVSVNLAASGAACSAGTTVHSGSFNANGTAATNQTLTLTTTAVPAASRLCLQTTGTTSWTGGTGFGGLTVEYRMP